MTLAEIAKRHDEWVAIALYLGAHPSYAEDAVQDLYIKLHTIQANEGNLNRLTYNGRLNTAYMFTAISNQITSHHRKKKNLRFEEVSFEYDVSIPHDRENAFKTLLNAVNECLDEQHWYDKKLLRVYLDEGHSIRSLSRATNISAKSIFITLKNVREKIKRECQEEYKHYQEESRKAEGQRVRRYGGKNNHSDGH